MVHPVCRLVAGFTALALAAPAWAQSHPAAHANGSAPKAAPAAGPAARTIAAPNTLTAAETAAGWQLLFDGKSLDGWRASEKPGTFTVVDGEIVVRGPMSHLYYVGPVENHDFTNFELKLDVKTYPHANSGVYFHTEWQAMDWPAKGYEVQVNNSHADTSRTGGLWGIKDNMVPPAKDGDWFTMTITVQGKHVITKVNDKTIVDYTEEEHPTRSADMARRLISSGTFALQGHDPDSEVHYRNIKVRKL
jgi:hypothetical protein